ncbi:MAG: hypothetical protein VX777_02885 [Chlamydiota bacterium]|nr:hypothetical protein [Chlamydiota bacterium]
MATLTPRSQILLKVLVDHYHSEAAGEVMAKSLPVETAQAIVNIPIFDADPKSLFISASDALAKIHYSWISDAFQYFDKSMHPLLLAVLSKSQGKSIEQLLGINTFDKELSTQMQKFLQMQLIGKIAGAKTVLPQDFLNPRPLTPLLSVDKNIILEMFDILGLYDLASKVKLIIDKKTLSNIYACLTPVKRKFLDLFLRQVDKVQLSELDLTDWSGDQNILRKMIHRRGILRLGKALAGYPPDFMWHLTHRLDTGRGSIINRHYEDSETDLSRKLTEQVVFIMNTLTKKNEQ